jgi:hypothetical protein
MRNSSNLLQYPLSETEEQIVFSDKFDLDKQINAMSFNGFVDWVANGFSSVDGDSEA